MSKLFLSGIPTEPDVKLLTETFPKIEVGDEINYESVEAVLRLDRKSSRFRTVTQAWRKKVLNDGIELAVVAGVGFRALSPKERIEHSVKGVQSGVRKQIRSINRSDRVITEDPLLRKKQEVLHRYAIALRKEATSTMQQLEPPKEQQQLPRVQMKAVS